MKKIVGVFLLLLFSIPSAWACDLCEEQQPSWLRGVVHGAGPKGMLDYFILTVSIIFLLIVLFYSVKFLVKPGEKDPSHIKYSILNSNQDTYGQ